MQTFLTKKIECGSFSGIFHRSEANKHFFSPLYIYYSAAMNGGDSKHRTYCGVDIHERSKGSKEKEIINQALCTERYLNTCSHCALVNSNTSKVLLSYMMMCCILELTQSPLIMYAVCELSFNFTYVLYAVKQKKENERMSSEYEEKQIWGIRSSPRAFHLLMKVPSTSTKMTTTATKNKNDEGMKHTEKCHADDEAKRIGNATTMSYPLIHDVYMFHIKPSS